MRRSSRIAGARILPLPLRLLVACAFIVFCAPLALGQGTTGSIAGKVTVQAAGRPIAGARVILVGLDGAPTLVGSYTDREGDYRIANVPPGRYHLRALRGAWSMVEVKDVLVTVGVVTTMNFQLPQGGQSGIISGTVRDHESGEPLAGANIVLYRADGTPTEIGALTNEDGAYRLLNVPPGRYRLQAALVSYRTMVVENLIVTVGLETRQLFSLERR